MGGEVAVPQPEPVLATDAGELVHRRPRLSGHAPTGLTVVQTGQRVGDGVEIRTDVKAVQHRVVAHVDDGHDVGGRHDAHEPGEHPGGPDAAAQGHQHGASIRVHVGRAAGPPLVPSPPALPCWCRGNSEAPAKKEPA